MLWKKTLSMRRVGWCQGVCLRSYVRSSNATYSCVGQYLCFCALCCVCVALLVRFVKLNDYCLPVLCLCLVLFLFYFVVLFRSICFPVLVVLFVWCVAMMACCSGTAVVFQCCCCVSEFLCPCESHHIALLFVPRPKKERKKEITRAFSHWR